MDIEQKALEKKDIQGPRRGITESDRIGILLETVHEQIRQVRTGLVAVKQQARKPEVFLLPETMTREKLIQVSKSPNEWCGSLKHDGTHAILVLEPTKTWLVQRVSGPRLCAGSKSSC